MIVKLTLVGLGGGVGSILRYLISVCFVRYQHTIPWATFIVNIVGCLLIGLLFGLSEKGSIISGEMKLFLMTGFCGGFTTFSAFSIESVQLWQNGNYFMLAVYVVGSVLLGCLSVWLGFQIVKL